MSFWVVSTAMAVIALFFVIGNAVSVKTKGYINSVLVAVIVFLALMYSGIVPPDITATAGLTGMVGTFVIPFCIVDVASTLKLKELKSEWKTALVIVVATLGIAVICATVGVAAIGRARAVGAIGPLGGALLAKVLKISPWLAMGISMCCYIGYPGSQIVAEEVIRGTTDLTAEETKACTEMIVPRMVLGYFVAAITSILAASVAVGFMF